MYFDIQSISNWIVSGFIGLFFGILSAWITHRYEKKRDDIAWEHEKEKLGQQFNQEKELAYLQFQQRLVELEKQISKQEKDAVRSALTKGLENPEKEIRNLEQFQNRITTGGTHYAVNTDGLRSASQMLLAKASEMEAAIRKVDVEIAPTRDMKSPRIAQNVEQWDRAKSKLSSEVDAAYQAVKIINQTAENVDAVMAG